jgi:polyhydroxybutyrate depolymerase
MPRPRRTSTAFVVAAALLVAVALPVLAAARPAPRPSGAVLVRSIGTLTVEGRERTYTLLRPVGPAAVATRPLALVVVLHGGFGTGEGAINQGNWDAAALRSRFMVVAPDGLGRAWNAGECCGTPAATDIDDVGFIRALVADLARRHPIDRERVYATGISNGGMMAYRLACDAGDVFAAVAPVAATLFTSCAPTRPVSLLHIHGLDDQNVPIDGGVGPRSVQRDPPSYPPVRQGVLAWAATDGCRASATSIAGPIATERWTGCTSPTAVELITIADAGHSWPGGERMSIVLDPPSQALDATAGIWRFFAAHPRPVRAAP